jgi:hypothetical protein
MGRGAHVWGGALSRLEGVHSLADEQLDTARIPAVDRDGGPRYLARSR